MQEEQDPHSAYQVALLEQHLASALSEEQRRRVMGRLSQASKWTPEAIAAIPDGTEPGFVFSPYRYHSAAAPQRGEHE